MTLMLSLVLALSAVASPPAPQAPPRRAPTFEAGVEVVKITASVRDAQGRPVTHLRPEDFEVRADGRREPVAYFSAPATGEMDLALLVDTSGSMAPWQQAVSSAAIRFLEQVPRARLRLLVSFDTQVRFWNVGSDAAALVSQMREAAVPGGATALRTAIAAALERFESPDRAALVVLTDGEDWGSLVGEKEILEAIESANVTVYALKYPSSNSDNPGWPFLTRITGKTGGRLFESRPDPAEVFTSISDDLASQYVLGIVPAATGPGFHRLAVKARTGARVRHRAGYRVSTGPAPLERTWARIARGAGGRVGAAAVLVETGERFELNADEPFPMQSVFKLPVALQALRLVDEGRLRLDAEVHLGAADMRRGHSPIRERWPEGVTLRVEDLLRFMLVESDNSAADALLALAGGPSAVTARLSALDVRGLRVDRSEADLARDLLDGGPGAMERYLADPRDTATANGMADLLVTIARGQELQPESHRRLSRWLEETATGRNRIRGRLPPGTAAGTRSGTGPTLAGVNACTNDVGLITLPDGRHVALAVFIKGSRAAETSREEAIARIARAAYDRWAVRR